MLEFAALDHVSRISECGNHFVIYDAGVTAAVVEMEMRVDDDVDIVGMVPVVAETLDQIRAIERVDVAKFVVMLVASAGLDQDALASGVNEDRIHHHRDAIARVRGSLL